MAQATDCQHCGTRLIFPVTADGKPLPPVELPPGMAPDPQGTMAVAQLGGIWEGKWLAHGEESGPPWVRRAVHHCAGRERERRDKGRTAVLRPRQPALFGGGR
jgi:hypothetical protein